MPDNSELTVPALNFNYTQRCLGRKPATKYQTACDTRLTNACHNHNHNAEAEQLGLSVRELRNTLQDKLRDDPSISHKAIQDMRRCQLNRLCKTKLFPSTTYRPKCTTSHGITVPSPSVPSPSVPSPSVPLPTTPYRKPSKPPNPTHPLPETPVTRYSDNIDNLQLPITFKCHNLDKTTLTKLLNHTVR